MASILIKAPDLPYRSKVQLSNNHLLVRHIFSIANSECKIYDIDNHTCKTPDSKQKKPTRNPNAPYIKLSLKEPDSIEYTIVKDITRLLRLDAETAAQNVSEAYAAFRKNFFPENLAHLIIQLYNIHPFLSIHFLSFIIDKSFNEYCISFSEKYFCNELEINENEMTAQQRDIYVQQFRQDLSNIFNIIEIFNYSNVSTLDEMCHKFDNWLSERSYAMPTPPTLPEENITSLINFLRNSIMLLIDLGLLDTSIEEKELYIFSLNSSHTFKDSYYKVIKTRSFIDDYLCTQLNHAFTYKNQEQLKKVYSLSKKNFESTTSYRYYIDNFDELILLELHYILSTKTRFKKCKLCGHFFSATRKDQLYCNYPYDSKNKTCKQIGAGIRYKENLSVPKQICRKIDNTLTKRLKRAEKDNRPTDKYEDALKKWKDALNSIYDIIDNNPSILKSIINSLPEDIQPRYLKEIDDYLDSNSEKQDYIS